MKKYLLLSILLLTFTACLMEQKIDASSEEAMQKSITKIVKSLSLEEQKSFQESMQIIMFSDVNDLSDLMAMGQSTEVTIGTFMGKVDGKTAAQIIEMANSIKSRKEAGQKYNDATERPSSSAETLERIAEKGKEKVKKNIFSKVVNVTLTDIELKSGDYSKYTNVKISFENLSEKNILGIKGVASFKDIFGDTIKRINLSSDEGVKAGEVFIYDGRIDVNQFIDSDLKLATTPKEKIQFSFEPEVILFEDGSKLE
jgi:hypothetical protein